MKFLIFVCFVASVSGCTPFKQTTFGLSFYPTNYHPRHYNPMPNYHTSTIHKARPSRYYNDEYKYNYFDNDFDVLSYPVSR